MKTVTIAALSKTHAPSPAPVIDWHGQICSDSSTGSRAGWLDDFVNGLGQSDHDRKPNSKIRIKL